MRIGWIIAGAVLAISSIPAYYYSPDFLYQWARSFVHSMTNGNSLNSVTMLHQMGYPHLSVVVSAIQYLLLGTFWMGIGFVAYGTVAKVKPKPMVVKLVTDQPLDELNTEMPHNTRSSIPHQTTKNNDSVSSEAVSEVLTKLETQLKDIKRGYENHKQVIEDEKKILEQKERERMAKIITAGEVLIK